MFNQFQHYNFEGLSEEEQIQLATHGSQQEEETINKSRERENRNLRLAPVASEQINEDEQLAWAITNSEQDAQDACAMTVAERHSRRDFKSQRNFHLLHSLQQLEVVNNAEHERSVGSAVGWNTLASNNLFRTIVQGQAPSTSVISRLNYHIEPSTSPMRVELLDHHHHQHHTHVHGDQIINAKVYVDDSGSVRSHSRSAALEGLYGKPTRPRQQRSETSSTLLKLTYRNQINKIKRLLPLDKKASVKKSVQVDDDEPSRLRQSSRQASLKTSTRNYARGDKERIFHDISRRVSSRTNQTNNNVLTYPTCRQSSRRPSVAPLLGHTSSLAPRGVDASNVLDNLRVSNDARDINHLHESAITELAPTLHPGSAARADMYESPLRTSIFELPSRPLSVHNALEQEDGFVDIGFEDDSASSNCWSAPSAPTAVPSTENVRTSRESSSRSHIFGLPADYAVSAIPAARRRIRPPIPRELGTPVSSRPATPQMLHQVPTGAIPLNRMDSPLPSHVPHVSQNDTGRASGVPTLGRREWELYGRPIADPPRLNVTGVPTGRNGINFDGDRGMRQLSRMPGYDNVPTKMPSLHGQDDRNKNGEKGAKLETLGTKAKKLEKKNQKTLRERM